MAADVEISALRRRLANALYFLHRHTIRNLLPRHTALYSGTRVGLRRRWGDEHFRRWRGLKPQRDPNIPQYESALVAGLRRLVQSGDSVVIVGGGAGVTAVVASQAADPAGRVTCFEAGAREMRAVKRTMQLNPLGAPIKLIHALVGPAIDVYSSSLRAARIGGADLPECDVLELDCEGSELAILAELKIRPRDILAESHGFLGSPRTAVEAALAALGYEVTNLGIAESGHPDICESRDVYVLHGRWPG